MPYSRTLAALVSAAVAASLLAPPASARSSAYYAWRNEGVTTFVWHQNKLYAEWQCDIGGAVAAAGFIWVTGAASAVYSIGAILSGGSFTAGCNLGASDNPGRMSGVPYSRNCWIVYPNFKWSRRTEECVA